MGHTNVAANANNNLNNQNQMSDNANAKPFQPPNKSLQTPIILQRIASQPMDITPHANNSVTTNEHNQQQHPLQHHQLEHHQMHQYQQLQQQQQQQQHQQQLLLQQSSFKNDKKKAFRRHEKTFGTPIDDPVLDEDFDFEKNLALFDKRAIWNKIEANQKPDVVS